MQCTPSSALFSGLLQVLARPCYLLAPCRLSRRMSNGTLVRATLVLSCLCVWSWLWRGLEALCLPSHYSWLEVGLGELAIDVVGVCCKLKSWCDIVVILCILVSLIQRRVRPLRILKKKTTEKLVPPCRWVKANPAHPTRTPLGPGGRRVVATRTPPTSPLTGARQRAAPLHTDAASLGPPNHVTRQGGGVSPSPARDEIPTFSASAASRGSRCCGPHLSESELLLGFSREETRWCALWYGEQRMGWIAWAGSLAEATYGMGRF
jgi:hypothetical protein